MIQGDRAARTLTELKAGHGGDIAMSGSPTTVRWLLRQGLLDQLNLFPGDETNARLELLSVDRFASGVLNLSYRQVAA